MDPLLADAVAWAAGVLGVPPDGQPTVLNTNPWGAVTARLRAGGRDLVLKASSSPEVRASGRLAELLDRAAPGLVPELLAWRADGDRVFTLFRRFEGEPAHRSRRVEPLVGMVRSLARVQDAFSRLTAAELAGLPRLEIRDVPPLLDGLLADVEERFRAWWRADGDDARFAVPDDLVPRMEGYRPRLAEWAEELAAGPVPLSVDHVDFLPHNAVVQPTGEVLLYDWEQAVLSCPLFSVDVLFLHAQQLERGDDRQLLPERATPATAAVRRAYLEALPWGTLAERERAFALAMCLAPIRYAWSEQRLATGTGAERAWSEDMAWWLTRALGRWERLTGRGRRAS